MFGAVFLPGGVLPGALAYPALVEALTDRLGKRFRPVVKELEVYGGPEPPDGYGLATEVAGILREADAAGFKRFHLVGYSGGGASSLAFASAHPDRLLSLALLESAWAGNTGLASEEQALQVEFRRIAELPDAERMGPFMRAQLAVGVVPPPPPDGPPPPWMAQRPGGIRAFIGAFDAAELDLEVLGSLEIPVYYALGGRSNPDYYARQAGRLAKVFRHFSVELYVDRHHFDPPHRIEPDRLADALVALWRRAPA
jgi:pimeloyl-ACP methyl ester carboxylesterase